MQRVRQHFNYWLRRLVAVPAAAVFFLAMPALALDPGKMMTQFHHQHWGAAEGVDKVRSITQTADGYIWIASGNRLLKFDGVQFTQWEKEPGERGIPGYLERAFSSRDGSLWVSSATLLTRILAGHSTNCTASDGMTSGHVVTMCESRDGVVWAGGSEGLSYFTNGHWTGLGPEFGLPKLSVRWIIFDRENTLWVSLEDTKNLKGGQIAWLRAGAAHFEISTNRSETAQNLALAPDGKIWAAQTARSVRAFTHDDHEIQFAFPEIAVGSGFVLFDRDGALWITTLGDGLRRIPNTAALGTENIGQTSKAIDQFTQKDGLTGDLVICAFEDREGNIWTGGSSGLDCFSENKVTSYSVREGMPFDHDLLLQTATDGNVWAASNPRGLVKILAATPTTNQASLLFTSRHDGLTAIYALLAGDSGELLAATSGGIVRMETGDANVRLLPGSEIFQKGAALAPEPEGGWWISDRELGLVWLKNGKIKQTIKRVPDPSPGNYISAAYADKSGNVWFGFANGEMSCREAGKFRLYASAQGLFSQQIRAYMEDAKGQLWVVGSGGIGRLHDGKFQFLTKDTGLPGDDFVAMLQDDDGAFWLGGMDGIFRISSAAMEKAFSSSTSKIAAEHFGFDDGLRGFVRQQNPSYPGVGYPMAAKSGDGRLWFSTSGGLAAIDPHRLLKNRVPPLVHVERIVTTSRTNRSFANMKFPSGTRSCEIDYIGLCYANPANVRYQYKLAGYDQDWVDAGTRRQAYYSNLRPQKYKFQVRACNNDGVWNESGDTIEFAILPGFYQTAWFPMLCMLAVALLIFGLHHLRQAQLAARMSLQLELQKEERKRIAQELHDTLLQGFTGIGLKLDAISNGLPAALDPTKQQLQKILEQSDQYLAEARRSVWKLRSPSLEKSGDFSKALADAGHRLIEGTNIRLDFSVTGTRRRLAPIIEDNLLRIGEEAVTNAVKHARATQMIVLLEFKSKEVQLHISDNGCGFDPQGADAAKAGHFGLVGIQERVKSLSGKLRLNSLPGQGTKIVVTVRAV